MGLSNWHYSINLFFLPLDLFTNRFCVGRPGYFQVVRQNGFLMNTVRQIINIYPRNTGQINKW